MPHDAFDEELAAMLERERGSPFDVLRVLVDALHIKHGRKIPPPIAGTVDLSEPDDHFGKRP